MNTAQRIDIWERIHEYVAACGGDSSAATVGARRERAVAALERGIEQIEYQAPVAPPWLSDVAEALGLVRPSDGAPLALNWTQALNDIRDLRDERDECRREMKQACVALADGFVPKHERAGAHLQGLPRLVAHAVEHHQWHNDAQDSSYVRTIEEQLAAARSLPLADEERRKLTGDALVAEDKLARIAAIVNCAFNGESPLDREQRATKALAAVADALEVPF